MQFGAAKWDFWIVDTASPDVRALRPELITESVQEGKLLNIEQFKWAENGLAAGRISG